MSDVVVRAATHDDIEPLLEFWQIAGENEARPADRPGLLQQLIDRDPEATILATQSGRIVATTIAGWDGWRANLYRLAVAPDRRGEGLAKLMLEHAERRFISLGAERSCAMVLEENQSGQTFWRSSGYTPQDEWRRWVKPI